MTKPSHAAKSPAEQVALFRSETVFHLVQSLILALRLDKTHRPEFSLDTALESAVNVENLRKIGEVSFEKRPRSRGGRFGVVAAGVVIYPFLPARHDYYGPILNRPLGLLRRYGRARRIVLLNEGRFSDPGLIRGRRNHIYSPAIWKRLSGYFVHALNPRVEGAVFTETSAPQRPKLATHTKEVFINVEAKFSAQGSAVQAVMQLVFGQQITHDVTRFSTLVVLPFFDALDQKSCDRIHSFVAARELNPDSTLFKIHPRTRATASCDGLCIETRTYPIELLLLFGHQFDTAYFINTSTNLKTIAREKIFLDAL